MSNIEIEIQVKVERVESLIDFLAREAMFKAQKLQVDEYYSPPHNDFLAVRPVREWLRLRDADGTHSINYKNWYYDADGKSQYCDEYETKVEDSEKLRLIFEALGYRKIAVVDKVRKTWVYKDYEVALDSVKGLGDFVEIEYVGADASAEPQAITNKMASFLKEVGCGKIERNYVGYPFQILFPDEVMFEEQ